MLLGIINISAMISQSKKQRFVQELRQSMEPVYAFNNKIVLCAGSQTEQEAGICVQQQDTHLVA